MNILSGFRHGHEWQYTRTIFGDEIMARQGRKEWMCKRCTLIRYSHEEPAP